MTETQGRTRSVARFGLIVFGLALPLLLFEAGLRVAGYQAFQWSERVNPQILTATDDPELPYVLTPNAHGRGWDTEIAVNSHGFRDHEYSKAKGDRFRIAAVGDSITFGSRLEPPSVLYPKQLEQLLQSRMSSRNVEVLNFGVTGYDVVNNVVNVSVRALHFQPDIVLLGFCINDIGTSSTAMAYIRAARYLRSPLFRSRVAQLTLSSGLKLWATVQSSDDENVEVFQRINRSRILPIDNDQGLRRMMDELADLNRRGKASGLIRWWTQPARIGFLEYGFDKLRSLKRRHGFDVVVVAIPLLDPRRKEQAQLVNRMIRHESLKFGFHFVDVFEPFDMAGLRRLRNDPSDEIHPGVKGHRIIATAVDKYLVTSGLLATSTH